ncbi:MAG: hypothetical protein AB7D51_02960 [Desulfovibrionaceae bacterium]
MTSTISAETDADIIRSLREQGHEIIFQVDESKSLDEIMAEIDWSGFDLQHAAPVEVLEAVREPVYHLDDESGLPRYRRREYEVI